MAVSIISFGPIRAITGSDKIIWEGERDTDHLIQRLHEYFPGLAKTPYIVAVDKQIIQGNMQLTGDQVVALLPPYSGG